jgi:telomere length regulation protein
MKSSKLRLQRRSSISMSRRGLVYISQQLVFDKIQPAAFEHCRQCPSFNYKIYFRHRGLLLGMEDLLVPVRTSRISVVEEVPASEGHGRKESTPISSAPDALDVLKSNPSLKEVGDALAYFQKSDNAGFSLKAPGPLAAQIINNLVERTMPDFWDQIANDSSLKNIKKNLISCLRCVSGLGALLAKMNALIKSLKNLQKAEKQKGSVWHLRSLLIVLEVSIRGDNYAQKILHDVESQITEATKRSIVWKEFATLTASGRVLSVAAETEDVLQRLEEKPPKRLWLSSGPDYASWLGRNVATLAAPLDAKSILWNAITQYLSKALGLGYNGKHYQTIFVALLIQGSS